MELSTMKGTVLNNLEIQALAIELARCVGPASKRPSTTFDHWLVCVSRRIVCRIEHNQTRVQKI